jgi:hypothetical protein
MLTAAIVAPEITADGDANGGAILVLWLASIPWATAVALLIVRQADLPDIATASMIATIAPFAIFALCAGIELRGTPAERDVVSTMFLGVTAGALTSMLVWGIAMGIARLLKLPTTAALSK